MLNETVLYLLVIGFLSLFKTQKKYDFLLSIFITLFFGVVFSFFCMDWKTGFESVATFILDETHSSNIRLDIISSVQNYTMIYPFAFITLFSMCNNLLVRHEANKKSESILFVFNLISFIMLIAGHNFIQLITFVFVVDILSQLLIKDAKAARRYSLYNFVADMGLFLVLAMIQGKLSNLDIANISRYYETGHHRDFIVFTILVSLSIKFGFFLFQRYWLDLRSAKFRNIYFLPYLSTPMAALVLFIKLYPILVVSPLFAPLLNAILLMTIICGIVGIFICEDNRDKFVYFNMMNVAFLVKIIEKADFLWNMHFSYLIILFYMFNACFYCMHEEIDRKKSSNKLTLFLIILGFFSVLSAISGQVLAFKNSSDRILIYIFLVLLTLLSALTIAKIRIKIRHNILFEKSFKTHFVLGCIILFSSWLLYGALENDWQLYFMVIFILLTFGFFPLGVLHAQQKVQESVCLKSFTEKFHMEKILNSLKNTHSIINIFLDFIFIEKMFLPALLSLNAYVIKIYRKISRYGLWYDMICVLLGTALMLYLLIE